MCREVLGWTAAAYDGKAGRHVWPVGHKTPMPGLGDFAALARRMSPDSVGIYTQGVGYLLDLLQIEEPGFAPAAALVGIHQTGLGEKVYQAALLNPSYSWTRKLTTGMSLYAQYQVNNMWRRNVSEAESAIRRLKEALFDEQKKATANTLPPPRARDRTQDPHRTRPHMHFRGARPRPTPEAFQWRCGASPPAPPEPNRTGARTPRPNPTNDSMSIRVRNRTQRPRNPRPPEPNRARPASTSKAIRPTIAPKRPAEPNARRAWAPEALHRRPPPPPPEPNPASTSGALRPQSPPRPNPT